MELIISSYNNIEVLAMQESQKEHVKYRVMAYVQRLCLNKKINFETKVTWKRNVNKVETEVATHQDCESVFNQMLELELNLVYNTAESKFQSKFTEFTVTVIYQGKVKCGGYIKYDAADIVNNNYADEKVYLNLMQCPDPEAYIEVVFNYEVIGQSSRSLFNELSMLNPIGFEQDLSQIDFQEQEQRKKEEGCLDNDASTSEKAISQTSIEKNNESQSSYRQSQDQSSQIEKQNKSPKIQKQYHKINRILDNFQSLSHRLSRNNTSINDASNTNEREEKLKLRIAELERELSKRQNLVSQYENKILESNRYIDELEIRLRLSEQQQSRAIEQTEKGFQILRESSSHFKQLYEKTLFDLDQLKQTVEAKANVVNTRNGNGQVSLKASSNSQRQGQLYQVNIELQTKLAAISHNMAQIFNAALDYGGAELLDYLQSSIGLIQH